MKPSFDANIQLGLLTPKEAGSAPVLFFVRLEGNGPFDLDFRTADVKFVEAIQRDLAEVIEAMRACTENREFDGTEAVDTPSDRDVMVTSLGVMPVDSEESNNPSAPGAPIEVK